MTVHIIADKEFIQINYQRIYKLLLNQKFMWKTWIIQLGNIQFNLNISHIFNYVRGESFRAKQYLFSRKLRHVYYFQNSTFAVLNFNLF